MADDEIKLNLVPVLESPPEGEASTRTSGLFGSESFAVTAAKLNIADSLMGLLIRDHSYQDFIREALLSVMRVINSEAGSFLEVDHVNQSLFFRCAVGTVSDRITDFTIPVGQGVVGHVAESRRPYAVSNTTENKIYLKSVGAAVGFEARNLVAVPVIIRGKVFGVLELLNRVGEQNYTDQDLELLDYFSRAAARVIEARLMIAWAKKNRQQGSDAA